MDKKNKEEEKLVGEAKEPEVQSIVTRVKQKFE